MEQEEDRSLSIQDYAGLAKKKPALAALMAIFMFSLSGIPPFAGFLGKYYVFAAAINSNLTWLAIVGVLSSVIGVYYYLRLVVVMYFQDVAIERTINISGLSFALLAIAAFCVTILGIIPSALLNTINNLF